MEQLTQEQNLYTTKNNKAVIGLILGVISLLSWISGPFVARITGDYRSFYIAIFAFVGVSVIGIIFAIIGFKPHKIVSVIAIVLCILGIFPSLIMANLMSSLGVSLYPNQVYKEADFSIEMPNDWVRLDSTSKAKEASIRVAFAPRQSNESYKPRISVTSLEIVEAKNLNTFAQGEEVAIRGEYNFISGRIMESEGKTFYVINYTLNDAGNKIQGTEFLAVKNGTGYIITAESLESSWEKYKTELTKSLLSFEAF